MNIKLEITSSNKNSIEKFNKILFNKLNEIKNIRFSVLKVINIKKKKKKFTVLKSPHVNKSAKEQFEIIFYTKIIKLYSYQYLLLLFIIKRLKINLNSEVQLKINLNYNSSIIKKYFKKNLNSNNVFLNLIKYKNSFDTSVSIKNYLKFFDIFGEILLKK